jgi:4-amino-4-deoxy-L-arabinose transferase-like glycosyltransferase
VILLLIWSVGMFGRGYWTPDEPREADIAWQMSRQTDKAVPSLAGQAFCEKPPLTYWIAGAAIAAFGPGAWAARLPNLLYAVIAALAMAALGRRSMNAVAGAAAAAALGTFLLSYQVSIWLATDAPLLAAVATALCGAYIGFYPDRPGDRWRGYTLMHAALALGFLSKSAAAWVVPALAILALAAWERRWRELLRPELYAGLLLQAAVIGSWVWFVHAAPDGDADLRVFFWNNLVGRFAHVDAPQDLQYAAAHKNFPGKYLAELPLYLWPWTLLVIAALRRAWVDRHRPTEELRPVRFALAAFVPALAVLSVAATARNVYLAPALPGLALLLGWWFDRIARDGDAWDRRALGFSAALLLFAMFSVGVAAAVIGRDSGRWGMPDGWRYAAIVGGGLLGTALIVGGALRGLRAGDLQGCSARLFLGYCLILIFPASQIYRHVDEWQDLAAVGRAISRDVGDRRLILFAPDETTRAFIDMYTRTAVFTIPGPVDSASLAGLHDALTADPRSLVTVQVPGQKDSRTWRDLRQALKLAPSAAAHRTVDALPAWAAATGLRTAYEYVVPNGRSYVLLQKPDAGLP